MELIEDLEVLTEIADAAIEATEEVAADLDLAPADVSEDGDQ